MLWCAFRSSDPLELRDLAVDGDDLRREGIPPGPLTGKILQSLLAMVLDDPALNVPDVLVREAKRLYEAFRAKDDGAGNGRE
jgi:tRNA nucleotidyltransferase (CCA-adding enzyme)